MKNNRTFSTLFLLTSVDGKISTGSTDSRDFDKDLPKITGVKEGLNQYYQLELQTDLYSLNTGKVMAKIGMNKKNRKIQKCGANFVIIDNKPHLNKTGVLNVLKKCQKLYLVTSNKKHPAFKIKGQNLTVVFYSKKVDFKDLFSKLKEKFGIERITIQSGGLLNSALLRNGLVDEVSLVIAPALVGGKETPTLVDGKSLVSEKDLKLVKTLKLLKCELLKDSYLHLVYAVKN